MEFPTSKTTFLPCQSGPDQREDNDRDIEHEENDETMTHLEGDDLVVGLPALLMKVFF